MTFFYTMIPFLVTLVTLVTVTTYRVLRARHARVHGCGCAVEAINSLTLYRKVCHHQSPNKESPAVIEVLPGDTPLSRVTAGRHRVTPVSKDGFRRARVSRGTIPAVS
jgi:hypothetical protein